MTRRKVFYVILATLMLVQPRSGRSEVFSKSCLWTAIRLFNRNESPTLYEVPLPGDLDSYAPKSLKADFSHYRGVKGVVLRTLTPTRYVRLLRNAYSNSFELASPDEGVFLPSVLAGKGPHNIVLTPERLVITPKGSTFVGDQLSKHSVEVGLPADVRFAGKIWVEANGDIWIDNESGTFSTPAETLPQVAKYLEKVLGRSVHYRVFRP